ncbi:type IV secretory system conjugative DNA transfer family protein [Jiangella aurantiaca]|uniref:Type IV secretory system conjugative DNA transfer family protein n=1 Tax=Jiangella aurantiaca TaxID=2530373 RepID=A0A4R4ZZK6_9ACTN|nr:TraM recognition domain-containing protein [Jiangella aurantiaca]TDD64791.1 type IV secretory system conjugative DNA transfer family protein [Jiangella aurantiaca]
MSTQTRTTNLPAIIAAVILTAWVTLFLPVPGEAKLAAGAVLVTALLYLVGRLLRRHRGAGTGTAATINRWSAKSRRQGGVASTWDLISHTSSWAMRRRAAVLRPSLGQLSWWRRWRTPVTAYATPLAKVGRLTVWSPCEDVTLRVGGPRTGKTGELACRIADAPGGVVATSTRTDIVELTAPIRQTQGHPTMVFNPSGLGRWASTVQWSPLTGCRDLTTAQRRAADMIPPSKSADAEVWHVQARRVLAVLLYAAALEELPMRAVLAWVSEPDARSADAVDRALSRVKDGPEIRSVRATADQFFGTNDRTQTSITTTLMPALTWLTDTRAAAIGDPDPAKAGKQLDLDTLAAGTGTLYLLGAEDGVTAPLLAALTAEVAHRARMRASEQPRGRLDPPLTIALDEAALVCPVPLDRWTADMGGRGITIHVSLQSRKQLQQRWGDEGAGTIVNNSSSIMVFGGTRDPDDLAAWSMLSGERDESVSTHDAGGDLASTTARKTPVLSPAQIANLPAQHVMIVRRGIPVSVGRAVMAWQRRDMRRAVRRAPYEPVLEPTATTTAAATTAEGTE